jgi:ABC-type sugar transport system ATPase subunit
MPHLLELMNVSKSFGEVRALRGVDFHVGENEIVGLLGDNGAGKSTLIKIVTGYHQPDSGELRWKGEAIDHLDVHRARELGIETVYQEKALADLQTLWRNIFMGRERTNRFGFLDVARMREETQKVLDFVGEIKAAGKSCIFIDHNIFHVYPIADRIVILDRGRNAGEFAKGEVSLEGLIDSMRQVAQTGSLA